MKRMNMRLIGAAVAAIALVGLAAGSTLATPASGIINAPVLARGAFTDRVDVQLRIQGAHGMHVSNANRSADVAMQRIEFGPQGQTGWHSHPGPAVVIIESGSFTLEWLELGTCMQASYGPGDAFVDHGQGRVHRGFNPSTTAGTILLVTYFDVPPGAPFRIDADNPGC
jgi:quercetin dioxygenase-like cupin family protein